MMHPAPDTARPAVIGRMLDRRRMFRCGQTLGMPRLPKWRRAAGWSGGRCVDGTLSRSALRSRVLFPEHGPAASSLPQGNCRPVDPRGSRPANLSTGAIEGWREPKWPNQPPHRSGELSTCVHNRRLTAVPAVVAGVIAGAHLGAFNVLSGPSSNRFYQDPAGASLLPVGARQGALIAGRLSFGSRPALFPARGL